MTRAHARALLPHGAAARRRCVQLFKPQLFANGTPADSPVPSQHFSQAPFASHAGGIAGIADLRKVRLLLLIRLSLRQPAGDTLLTKS